MKPSIYPLFYKILYKLALTHWFIFRPKVYGAICLIESEEKFLLIRNTYSFTDKWKLPGGHIKKGESKRQGVVREIWEEVKIQVSPKSLKLLGVYRTRAEYKKDTVYCYHIKLRNQPKVQIDNKEIAEARWFPKKQLPRNLYKSTKFVLDLLE